MSEEIVPGGVPVALAAELTAQPRLVPIQVGNAELYIHQVGLELLSEDEGGDGIHPVGVGPVSDVFARAGDALTECVREIGDKVRAVSDAIAPQEVTVEFVITFETVAKHAIVPVLVTAEHKVSTGIKVTAKWSEEAKEVAG